MNGLPWSDVDQTLLAILYPELPTLKVAELLGRAISTVYRKAHVERLKKSQAFLESEDNGRLRKGQTRPASVPHRFQKGQVPFNKGLRRPGWSPGRMRDTQFKKGCRGGAAARNWKPVGTIAPDSEGYLRIKVREAEYGKEAYGFGNMKVWRLYNRYLWEQAHGPIPPKHLVIFKDGKRSNCVLENLELISMAENARRNVMWRTMPRELAEVIHLQGQLKRIIRNKDAKQQSQHDQ